MAERAEIVVTGVVQGVGFRPFVFNLAESLHLNGYVDQHERRRAHRRGRVMPSRFSSSACGTKLLRFRRSPTSLLRSLPVQGYSGFHHTHQSRPVRAVPVHAGLARHLDLCRLPQGDARSGRSAIPLSVHQLHQLRSPFFHHAFGPLRQAEYDHVRLHHVPGLREGIQRTPATGDSMLSPTPARNADRMSSTG